MPNGSRRVGVAALDNLAQPRLLTGDIDRVRELINPTWSPDGKSICYVAHQDLWTVPVSGDPAKRLTSEGGRDFEPAWSPDGRHVYFSSYREGTLALWRVSAGGGSPQRITSGTAHERHPSISRDGKLLIHAADRSQRQLLLLDRDSGKEQALPGLEWYMASIAPDKSKIVFVSTRSGSDRNLWVQPLHNGNPAAPPYRLTDKIGFASHPAFSPDGRWVAYCWGSQGQNDIWIIPASGGEPVQFAEHSARDLHPAWSPDGSTIVFVSMRGGSAQIWTCAVKDGKPAGPAKLISKGDFTAFAPAWSRDGATIAFGGLQNGQNEVWLVPSDGSAPARRVTRGADIRRLRWNWATGELLVSGTWGEDKVTLRVVSPEKDDPRVFQPYIELGGKRSAGLFDISADGKLLVFSREVTNGEIWALKAGRIVF
jgi:TolB protein